MVWVGYATPDQRLEALRFVEGLRAGGVDVIFGDQAQSLPAAQASVHLLQRAGRMEHHPATGGARVAPVTVSALLQTLGRPTSAPGEEPS